MNDVDIELLLYRVLCGKLLFQHNGSEYELRCPDHKLKYKAQLLYTNIINDEKYNDWIREDQTESVLIMLGLWTKDTM
jgi:predicted nucleic acid-binding protein